jgi:hypothetical protein
MEEMTDTAMGATELLAKFDVLPANYAGKEFVESFIINGPFQKSLGAAELIALGLPIGATVRTTATIRGYHLQVFAIGKSAEMALTFAKGQRIDACVKTMFGIAEYPHYSKDGTIIERNAVRGVLITKLRNTMAQQDISEH